MDWLPILGAFGIGSVLTTLVGGIVTHLLSERSKKSERQFLIEQKNKDDLKENIRKTYAEAVKIVVDGGNKTIKDWANAETNIIIFASPPVRTQFEKVKKAHNDFTEVLREIGEDSLTELQNTIYLEEREKLIEQIRAEVDKL